MITMVLRPLLWLVLAAPAAANPVSDAERFAGWFATGDFSPMFTLAADELRRAMSEEQLGQIRQGLLDQYGALREVGAARWQDRVQQYMRYRVPLVFEGGTIDLLLAFDGDQRVAGMFLVPHVPAPAAASPPGPEIEVTIGDDFTGLPGVLTLPKGSGPFPAAVLVPGSGPMDRDGTVGANKPYRDLAWGLAERGVAILRFDKRSYARPGDLAALGESITVEEEILGDALAALEVLRAQRDVDAGATFVIGHSLGGTIAPRIAERTTLKGIVVLEGATRPLPETVLEQVRYVVALDSVVTADERTRLDEIEREVAILRAGLNGRRQVTGLHLGAPLGYFRDLEAHDAPFDLARSGLPCLVVSGSRDYQVTAEDFARWREALAGRPQACLREIAGMDHLLRKGTGPSSPTDYETPRPVAPEVIDLVARWILTGACDR